MPRILLTRPQDRSEAFAAEIAECGWDAVIWPLLTIRNRLVGPLRPAADQTLIFTSARAVQALPQPAPIDAPAVCVGPATAAAARERGFADVSVVAGDAEGLVQSLIAAAPRNYLHVRGVHSRGDVAARLSQAGRPTGELIAYEAVAAAQSPEEIDTAFKAGKIDAVALFSPRSASIFSQLAQADWLGRRVTAYVISPATADPVRDTGFGRVVVAASPDGQAMRAAICSAVTG